MSTILSAQMYNNDTLTQKFRVRKSLFLHALRLQLLKYGTLTDGLLTVSIKDGSTTLGSNTLTFTQLNSASSDPYFYGMYSLLFNLSLNGRLQDEEFHEYTIELSLTGHTDSDSVWVGWNKIWDNPYIDLYGDNQTSGQANSDTYESYSFEIIEKKV